VRDANYIENLKHVKQEFSRAGLMLQSLSLKGDGQERKGHPEREPAAAAQVD